MSRRLFRGERAPAGGLSAAALAPLVDLLTLLLVAILRTWSADPPPSLSEPGIELPVTRADAPPGRGVAVDIGRSGIYVDGWRVASARYEARSGGIIVEGLYEALQQGAARRVLVRADAEAPWALVGKVLATVRQAGVERVELVAVSRASL